MTAIIIGLGTALPGTVIPTDSFIQHAKRFNCRSTKQERVLEELYRRTTIASRCSVLASGGYGADAEKLFYEPSDTRDRGPSTENRMRCYELEGGVLAERAARVALLDGNVDAHLVTHLVSVSCTGFSAPGFDLHLLDSLPLNRQVQRTHVGFMGCHGALNGLRVAKAIAESCISAVVLLCATELCSLHFQYGWGSNKLVANSLFADGSAAAIVTSDGNGVCKSTAHSGRVCKVIASGSYVIPETCDAMLWKIGDYGFQMELSSKIPEIVEANLFNWLSTWLSSVNIDLSEIDGWAVHPGGPRILDAVESALSLHPSAMMPSRNILAEYGNMSSPTVFFILERLRSISARGRIVLLGFGPGLTIEATLLLIA